MKKIIPILLRHISIKDKVLWIMGMSFMLISAVITLYYPIMFNHFIEDIPIINLAKLRVIVALFLIHLITISFSSYILGILGEKYVKNIRVYTIEKYLETYITDGNYTELSSRIMYISESISVLISQHIPKIIVSIIQLIIIIYIIILISYKITLLITTEIFVAFVNSMVLGKKIGRIHLSYQNLISKINQLLTEMFERRMLIKLNGTEEIEKKTVFSHIYHSYNLSKRILLFNSVQYIIKQLIIMSMISLTGFFIYKEMNSGSITKSDVRLYIMYCLELLPPMLSIAEELTTIFDNRVLLMGLYNQVKGFSKYKIQNNPKVLANGTFIELSNISNGKIKIDHYLFNPKYVYQIVGISGVGKSTLIERILGISNLYKGDVKVSFKSAKCIYEGISCYHNKQNIIVGKTIRENLKYFQDYKDEELMQVLSLFGLSLDNQFDILDTIVSRETLSTGQLSRIALAREFLKKEVEITILDEPYSHLDENSAKKIDYLFRKKCKDSVLIIISHKKELFHKDDKILELSCPK